MQESEERDQLKAPIVAVDQSLNQYKDQVLFKEKVEKANDALRAVGLPRVMDKPQA